MFVSSAWEDMLKAYNLPGYKPSTLDIYKGIDPWITTAISDILNQGWRMRNKIEKLLVMVAVFSFSSESLYINITAANIDRIFQPRASVYLLSQKSSSRSGDSQILSSPDLSQRKRRLAVEQGSQDSRSSSGAISVLSSSESPSNAESQDSIRSIGSSPLKRRIISPSPTPDWASTQPRASQNPFVRRPNVSSQGSSGPNHAHGSQNIQDLHSLSPIVSSQESEQGIQFQSLMPTFGHGTNKTPQQSQMTTPIFSVGAPTPRMPPVSALATSSVMPRSSLASFAAPANLRKRSSPRSSSSSAPSSKSPSLGSIAAPSSVRGFNWSDTNQSSGLQGSPDWPDDLDNILFEEELATSEVPLHRNNATNTTAGGANPAPPPPQVQPQPQPSVADDDLDLLFGGLDENELLDDF
ncbi:hypothetical protein BG006_006794 [Podila minutissima]|uniref:Uncharacterized protein n=1 Tax=Podila minutissima TaxID=64525 RepID=A0A9P5VLD2_9FUNG|nr:hypothetical protein BG006_006794 [Podila minutissima]